MLWEAKTVPEGPLIVARQFTGGGGVNIEPRPRRDA
jgi:hypothetical protein